jgi:hypothetical protein
MDRGPSVMKASPLIFRIVYLSHHLDRLNDGTHLSRLKFARGGLGPIGFFALFRMPDPTREECL